MGIQMENSILDVVAIWGTSFIAYFVGIVIRKVALPGQGSPPLSCQVLLGIPISLVNVPAFVAPLVLSNSLGLVPFLVTLGTLMENGMIVVETATKMLENSRNQSGITKVSTPAGM